MNKRLIMVLVAIMAACTVALAQTTYTLNQAGSSGNTFEINCPAGGSSENNPAALLYDSGGASGNYSANESIIRDIASNNAGAISLKFTAFNLGSGTVMTIKDGISQQVLVSNATSTSLNGRTFTSNRGSLQIIWSSSSTTGAGFAAKIWCGDMCQTFQTTINPSVSPTSELNQATGQYETFYDVCNGTAVSFTASTHFDVTSGGQYDQSESTLVYHWGIINSNNDTVHPQGQTGQTLNYTFTESGGFMVICSAEDTRGCLNRNINTRKVRVSLRPTWPNVSFGPDSICPGTTVSLHGEPHIEPWVGIRPPIVAGSTFLPDGNSTCYNTSLDFDIFADGATIRSINDIERVYLNMEHSYLGDLSMVLQCPNGQMCLLHAYSSGTMSSLHWTNHGGVNVPGSSGGGNTHLGHAPDPGSSSDCYYTAGEGYSYNFTPTSTTPFGSGGPQTSTTYTDPCGNTETTQVLNEGDYGTYESMSSLIGCPLNGTWTIYVCDHLSADNGWIFEWGLYFAADLYPNDTWSFTNTYQTNGYSWSGVGIQSGQNGSANATATVQNPNPDNWSEMPYTFSATDNFGCTYDTTLLVHVKPSHHADCCIEPTPTVTAGSTNPCGNSTTLSAGSFAYPQNTGQWTYTGPGTATFSSPNQPTTDVTVNVYGDYTFTWHEYYMGNETCTGESSVNVNFAREMNATLAPVDNCCRSASMIQLSAQDFGTLTCNPSTEALNVDARTFTPSLANPGRYSITNTISGERCASPATSTITFTVYDEIVVSNRTETCNQADPAHPSVDVTFSVNGIAGGNPPEYNVTGSYTENEDNQFGTATQGTITANGLTSATYSFTRYSALDYALTVTDNHGCSSVSVAGYFACDCPYYAGTFLDYNPHIMCTGDTYNVGDITVGHQGDQAAAGTFSYIICTNPNDINNSWITTLPGTTNTIALGSIPNSREGEQYYLVAVEGNGEGLNAWTSGCRSISQAVPLMWKASPRPTVTGGETCGLVVQLQGSEVPSGMNGYWTATAPDGINNYSYTTIENTTNIMNNPRVLSSHYGRITYTWHVVNAECTGEASAIYNFRQIPSPEAGPNMTVCGVTAEITGANPTIPAIESSTLQWTGTGVVMSPANSIQPTANANSAGTYVLTLTERNGECAGSDNMTITFINVPAPATTANVDTVCGHTAELQVYNTNPANEGRWTAYDMQGHVLPSVIYHNYNNPNSASSDRYPHCFVTVPIPDDVTEVEYEFRWTEPISDPRIPADVSCMGEAVKQVVFRKVPVISVHQCGATGNHVDVCGRTVELCAETAASAGYTDFVWMVKADDIAGTFADSSQTSTSFTLDPSIHITRFQDVDIYFIGRNQTCISIDTMHVRFLERPVPNAGLDHIACGLSYQLNGEWSLSPSDDYTPACTWEVGERPSGARVTWLSGQADDITEEVAVSRAGVYTFILLEQNTAGASSTCYDRDTVTIEFMVVPEAHADALFRDTINVCGLDFQLNAISSHVEGDNIEGTWMSMDGGTATFADRHDPHTTGHYSAYGPARFRWVETNHPQIQTENEETCSDDDIVVVMFYEIPSPVISMSPSDTAVCGLSFSSLRAEYPGDGIHGFWWEENPYTQFGPNNQTVNQTMSEVFVSSYGVHNFYWIEYTGPDGDQHFCKDTAGPWSIEFIEMPDADIVDEEITFCGLVGQLHVNFNGVGEGVWSTHTPSSILSFEDDTDPNTHITSLIYNSNNASTPYYEIYWSVYNTDLCSDMDTARLIFAVVPSDSIKVIPPKCFGGPAILTANDVSLPTYDWEYGNGYIDTTYTNAQDGEYRVFIHWEDRLDSHIVGLITTNQWGCQSNIGRAVVEEPFLPEYDYRIIGDTCGLGRGGIEFLDTTGIFSFFWIDTTAGPTITNPDMGYAITNYHVYNLPAGTYVYRSDYQTFNREYMSSYQQYFNNDIYCHDFPRIEIGTIGMIDAQFAVSADVVLANLVAPEAEVTFVNSTNYDNISNKKCEWHFGDGVVEKNCDELIQHTYTEPGCYEPYLIVMNRDIQECRDTAFLDECVFVDKASKLEVPNIFSPNGDGINDFFQVNAQTLRTFNGKILNRYGRVVFEWTDWENEDAGWDGRLNGSTKATPGVYYYIIDAEGYDGVSYPLEGALHLVR